MRVCSFSQRTHTHIKKNPLSKNCLLCKCIPTLKKGLIHVAKNQNKNFKCQNLRQICFIDSITRCRESEPIILPAVFIQIELYMLAKKLLHSLFLSPDTHLKMYSSIHFMFYLENNAFSRFCYILLAEAPQSILWQLYASSQWNSIPNDKRTC